jgi:phage gp29-like protein
MANYKTTAVGFKAADQLKEVVRSGRLLETRFINAQMQRGRQLIDDWMKALRAAENPEKPNRELLYKLYHNLLVDVDLEAEWETKRKLRLMGTDFSMYDAENKPNDEATKLLERKWFAEMIGHALDSHLFGHSLLEVKSLDSAGMIYNIELVPRRNVIPEKGMYIPKIGDEKGILYREDPAYSAWLFEFGRPENLGLLAKAAPYILFQRFALSAWSEYGEKFVMPLRVAKTNTKDNESLNRLDTMMLDMATASYAILDKEETVEFVQSSATDGSSVYDKLMERCAAKLSKLFNGSVIGEASQGGSRSKEEVGQDIQDIVTNGDYKWIEGIMNQEIIPRLILMGYPFEGLTFKYSRTEDLQSLWTIYNGLLNHYDIPEEHITDKFNVPVTKKAVPINKPDLKAKGDGDFFG